MSSSTTDPAASTGSNSRGLPPLPLDQRSANSREGSEPSQIAAQQSTDSSSTIMRQPTAISLTQEPTPSTNLNPIVESTGPEYPAETHMSDSRGNTRSLHRLDVPAEDGRLAGIGAHGRPTTTTGRTPSASYSIRTPRRISTFDEGGRYSAASQMGGPGSDNGQVTMMPRSSRQNTYEEGFGMQPGQRTSIRRSQIASAQGDGGPPRSGGPVESWIVPLDKTTNPQARLTVRERIEPTLALAQAERDKYARKAKMSGYALNAAIGAQVVLGALTTGLSAALSGDQVRVVTATLGGLSTIAASYLARARGSNEPELSISRTKDLEQFIRECQAFKLDYGHLYGVDHVESPEGINNRSPDGTKHESEEGTPMERFLDSKLEELRNRFENMLGNASGERKLQEPLSGLHKSAV